MTGYWAWNVQSCRPTASPCDGMPPTRSTQPTSATTVGGDWSRLLQSLCCGKSDNCRVGRAKRAPPARNTPGLVGLASLDPPYRCFRNRNYRRPTDDLQTTYRRRTDDGHQRMSSTTQATLLERLRDGDAVMAWDEFFDRYWRLIFTAARRRGCREHTAEEIVQEVMLTVFRQPATSFATTENAVDFATGCERSSATPWPHTAGRRPSARGPKAASRTTTCPSRPTRRRPTRPGTPPSSSRCLPPC